MEWSGVGRWVSLCLLKRGLRMMARGMLRVGKCV